MEAGFDKYCSALFTGIILCSAVDVEYSNRPIPRVSSVDVRMKMERDMPCLTRNMH
jgi:hypothetical protein